MRLYFHDSGGSHGDAGKENVRSYKMSAMSTSKITSVPVTFQLDFYGERTFG